MLHGPNGEDGTIQGLFELMRQPYVGAGVLSSAVSMDKQAGKPLSQGRAWRRFPTMCTADQLQNAADRTSLIERIESGLGYPCFVKKPTSALPWASARRGTVTSSARAGLAAGLDARIVVEQGVQARELECAVLGGATLRASVVGEVRFDADWYDYETKYTAGRSTTLIPAPLSEAIERIQVLSIQACTAVGVSGMARVDFFYDDNTDQLWLTVLCLHSPARACIRCCGPPVA